MTQTTHSLKIAPARADELQRRLAENGYTFADREHMVWQARGDGAVISFYKSGKVVVQGANADHARALLTGEDEIEAPGSASKANAGALSIDPHEGRLHRAWRQLPEPLPQSWIGIDETGKGDFFGPLVTCAVRVELSDLPWLDELGVGDSKGINDREIERLAPLLRKALPFHEVVLMPEKYNELYERFSNLNKLLAWSHAAAAETVLDNVQAELVLSDQFAKAEIVPRYFKGSGKSVRYAQRTRAESDAAVGCASIIARATFLSRMRTLEREIGMKLHRGAGPPVIAVGRRYVERRGFDQLGRVAKLHFKTIEKLRP